MTATRVLLVDDESLVRRILKQILTSYPDMELVGEAATGYEAVAAVERLQPDIVVMDIRMPGLDGIAASQNYRLVRVCVWIQYRCDGKGRGGRGLCKIECLGRTIPGN